MKFVRLLLMVALLFLITLLNGRRVLSDTSNGMRVEKISPGWKSDSLKICAEFVNLFSDKTVNTIRSGLPAMIQIEIRLQAENGKVIIAKIMAINIEFDILANHYKTTSGGIVRFLSDFEDVKRICELTDQFLITKQQLVPSTSYTVSVRVGVTPVSEQLFDKVTSWLLNADQSSKLASRKTSNFNINRLVSYFVKGELNKYVSEWFYSDPFGIDELFVYEALKYNLPGNPSKNNQVGSVPESFEDPI